MRGFLFAISLFSFIIGVALLIFPDRNSSPASFLIASVISITGLSICEYLAFILAELQSARRRN